MYPSDTYILQRLEAASIPDTAPPLCALPGIPCPDLLVLGEPALPAPMCELSVPSQSSCLLPLPWPVLTSFSFSPLDWDLFEAEIVSDYSVILTPSPTPCLD